MLLDLFFSFFKIGIFSFGGGYAMISLLQETAVSKAWLTVSEFTDIVAISQITPGPIAVNMATFVGFRQAGILGSAIATIAVSLPSLIIVIVVLHFLKKFNSSKLIQNIFYGLRPAVCGLILAAVLQIAEMEFIMEDSNRLDINITALGISAIVLVVLIKFKVSPVLIILLSAVVGIFLGYI